MEARTRAHRRRHLAHGHALHGLDEQVGQPRRRPRADLATARLVAVFRDLARDLREVFAGLHAGQRGVDARLALGHRRGIGAFGHGDEDLRQVHLGVGLHRAALLFDVALDLGVGHADAGHDLAFTDALDQHLVAQVGAEARVVDAFGAQALAQLLRGELVLRGDALHGAVDLGLFDAQAAVARVGDDDTLVDQQVQHLLAQHGVGRQALAAARGVGPGACDAAVDLAGGDELAVDDGNDVVAVAFAALGGSRAGGGQRRQHGQHRSHHLAAP